MDWQNVLYWISIVLMWVATAMNVYAFIRGTWNYKNLKETRERYEEAIERYEEAVDKYYDQITKYAKENNNETDAL